MKCFVVADVHSFYDEMTAVLNDKGFDKDNPQHVFISLGDLLDRGPKPIECLEFVNSLERKILVRGNHEDLMMEAINRGCFYSHDISNGTFDTAQKVSGIPYDNETDNQEIILENFSKNDLWNTYYNQTIDYIETDKYVFVHGWIPLVEEGKDWRKGSWNSARWENGMACWNRNIRINNKTVLCGHWHTSWGHRFLHHDGLEFNEYDAFEKFFPDINLKGLKAKFTPFKDDGIIALDACTAYSGLVNCVVLNIAKKQLEKYLCLSEEKD